MIKADPLAGKRIVLTRHSEGASRLGLRLRALGAEIFELPLIEMEYAVDVEKAEDVFAEFGQYEWIIFTSRNGVSFFFKAFFSRYNDIRSLGFIKVAAIGEGTVEALGDFFLHPELVPKRATADDLAVALKQEQTLDNLRVLVVTGNRNREDLMKHLANERAIVDTLQVYKTNICDLSKDPMAELFRKEGADALVFASSSAVQAFGEQAQHLKLSKGAKVPALCSFGPVTSEKMKEVGIPVAVESNDPGLQGIVDALVSHFSSSGK
jgi:uroporphyrinogen-III synthase